jgi:hypothetical protein
MKQRILILFFIFNSVYALCQQNEGALLSRIVLLGDSVCSSTILTKKNLNELSKSFGVSIEDSLKTFNSQYVEARKRIMYSIVLEDKIVVIVSRVPLFDLDKYFSWPGITSSKAKEKTDVTFETEWWAEELKDMPTKVFTHPRFK